MGLFVDTPKLTKSVRLQASCAQRSAAALHVCSCAALLCAFGVYGLGGSTGTVCDAALPCMHTTHTCRVSLSHVQATTKPGSIMSAAPASPGEPHSSCQPGHTVPAFTGGLQQQQQQPGGLDTRHWQVADFSRAGQASLCLSCSCWPAPKAILLLASGRGIVFDGACSSGCCMCVLSAATAAAQSFVTVTADSVGRLVTALPQSQTVYGRALQPVYVVCLSCLRFGVGCLVPWPDAHAASSACRTRQPLQWVHVGQHDMLLPGHTCLGVLAARLWSVRLCRLSVSTDVADLSAWLSARVHVCACDSLCCVCWRLWAVHFVAPDLQAVVSGLPVQALI